MNRVAVIIFFWALLASCQPVHGQDSNYWSEQYGTRSELLGGAVVGSPQDLSTTFYNPGGLAYLKTESFLLSAKAFEYKRLTAQESSGRFKDLSTDRLGASPSLFSGTFPRSWTQGTLAYSFLTRQRFELRVDNWSTAGTSSTDSVATNLFIDARVLENWGGVTWSQSVGDIGVGVTLYGAYRSQRGRTELLTTGFPGAEVAAVNDYNYWHFRLLAKMGLYWEQEPISLGITVTTPGVGLFGDGKAAYYRSAVSADSTLAVPALSEVGVFNEPHVSYRSPASVAIGARFDFGRNAVYTTIEAFAPVERYRVLDAPAVPVSGIGSTLGAVLTQELRSVVNVAIGYEYSPRKNLTFYGSFLTDFSSATDDPSAGHTLSTWDIYQVTGGVAFIANNTDFTLGASYARGGEPIYLQNDIGVAARLEQIEIQYRKIKVFIGFEF